MRLSPRFLLRPLPLVTILVLALGVLLLVPLQPILQSPLQPAFEKRGAGPFSALMAYKYFREI